MANWIPGGEISLLWLSTGLLMTAVMLIVGIFTQALAAPRADLFLNLSELERVQRLRQHSRVFYWFEPLVESWARAWEQNQPLLAERLQQDLDLIEPEMNWRAGEFYAIKRIESALLFPVGSLLGFVAVGPLLGLVFSGLLTYAYPLLALNSVRKRAQQYRLRIRNRLPLLTDCCALMMDAGEDLIRNCLKKVAEESQGHPLGTELKRLETSLGFHIPENKALQEMAQRVGDPDLSEFVFMVTTANQRGVPVAYVLSEMAARLRNRRVQWLEQAAEEAKVKITGPALLVMLACLLIIVAPFVLSGANPG
jgi:Flp pilus assembly protein TadB